MKELLIQSWNKFKSQPDIWFFFGFLLIFPFSIRKVFFSFPIQGSFNEYSSVYLYASDFFILAILFYTIIYILCNINAILSTYKAHISTFFQNLYILLPFLLVILSFLSIIWSQNKTIAFYRSIKLFESYSIYIYIILRLIPTLLFHVEQYTCQSNDNKNVPRGTIKYFLTWKKFLLIIVTLGVFQSFVGVWQFVIQHSIGFFWLKESIISPNIAGVAKIILNNQRYIRAYGLFPHPNILGGFLLFSIVVTSLYKDTNCSMWNNYINYTRDKTTRFFGIDRPHINVPRGTILGLSIPANINFFIEKLRIKKVWLINSFLCIQGIALLLTFSKSAIIGLIISLVYIKLFHVKQFVKYNSTGKNTLTNNVPRGTFNKLQEIYFSKKQLSTDCSTWNIFKRKFQEINSLTEISNSFRIYLDNHNCSTWNNMINSIVSRVGKAKKAIILAFISILTILLLKPNFYALFFQSLEERLFYLNVSRGTILSSPIIGIGSGQSVISLSDFIKKPLEIWQFQPVHNIYLLMWSELGIFALGLFLWLICKLFHVEQNIKAKQTRDSRLNNQNCSTWNNRVNQIEGKGSSLYKENVPRGTLELNGQGIPMTFSIQEDNTILYNNYNILSTRTSLVYFQGILLGLLFIGLFDHYLWDIWPGQIIFWLTMGVVAGLQKSKNMLLSK